jgi:hypothetical protein
MDLLLTKFLGLLEAETDLYRSLLSILRQEKKAVVLSNLKELNESSKEKENVILKIRILEEQRSQLSGKIADALGYSGRMLTLHKLADMVEEPYSARLRHNQSVLSALVHSLQEVNNTNKTLILHSLELVRGSLTLFSNLVNPHSVYFRTGEIKTGGQSGMLICGST